MLSTLKIDQKFASNALMYLKLLYHLCVITGALIIFSYCIKIGFHPTGLAVGDALLFLLTMLAFCFAYFVALIYSSFSLFWLVRLVIAALSIALPPAVHQFDQNEPSPMAIGRFAKRIQPKYAIRIRKEFRYWLLSLASFLIFLLLVIPISLLSVKNPQRFIEISDAIYAFATQSLCVIAALCIESSMKDDNGKSNESSTIKKYKQHILMLMFIVVIPIFMGAGGFLVDTAMEMIGIRFKNTPVQVSEENYQKVTQVSGALNLQIFSCKTDSSNDRIVFGIDTLWSGVGDTVYIRIYGNDIYADFKLDDKGYSPISTKRQIPRCNP